MAEANKTKAMSFGNNVLSKPYFRAAFGVLADWVNLACLLFALGTAVWSVEQAEWVKPSPSFIAIFILAVLSGFILAKSRLPAYLAHIISLVLAVMTLFCQGLILVNGLDLLSRTMNFVTSIQDWWYSQVNSIPATSTLHIALIFGFLTWIIGYFSTWPLVKKRNPWIAVLLGTVTILINLNFWRSDKYHYFAIFLVGALALIATTTYAKYNLRLIKTVQNGNRPAAKAWAGLAAGLIIIAVGFTWISPGFRVAAIADYSRVNTPFQGSFKLFWQNFFATVPGSGAPKLLHGGQEELRLGGPLELSNQVNFIIKSDYRTYWKTQTYDYYELGTWKIRDVDLEHVYTGIDGAPEIKGSQLINYTVIPQVDTNVIPTTGELATGSVTIIEKSFSRMVFEVDLVRPVTFIQLPADIFSVASTMSTVNLHTLRGSHWAWLQSMLPSDLELVDMKWDHGLVRGFSIARKLPQIKDTVALTAANIIKHQNPVSITVEVPRQYSVDELKASSGNFPLQITDRYLQLQTNYPGRVKELTSSIVQSSLTQYDKVEAIINFLKGFPYNLKIAAPPSDADGVDYFLFTGKSGYCTYYASAMAVMLRSIGIPTRLAVGFLPGQFDQKTQSYIVRDRDYHAWTEVYFADKGWITFDPTPSTTGESADYSIYYILPPRPSDTGQSVIRPSPPEQSTQTGLGSYIGMGIGAIAGLAVLLVIAFFAWIYRQPRSNLDMYRRMVLLSSLGGRGPKRWQTALEFSSNVASIIPRYAKGINRIGEEYTVLRYHDRHAEVSPPDDLEDTWPIIRRELVRRWLHIDWLLE